MIKVITDKGLKEFNVEKYRGQEYDPQEKALTVAIIEDTAEVYLVPLKESRDGAHHLQIKELHNYLEAIGLGTVWTKTHTVFRETYADFLNPF
jgi:hypothetical protein